MTLRARHLFAAAVLAADVLAASASRFRGVSLVDVSGHELETPPEPGPGTPPDTVPEEDPTDDLQCVDIDANWPYTISWDHVEELKLAEYIDPPNEDTPDWPIQAYFSYDEDQWEAIFGTIDDDGTDVDDVSVYRAREVAYTGKVRVWNPNKDSSKPYYWGRTEPYEGFEFTSIDKICAPPVPSPSPSLSPSLSPSPSPDPSPSPSPPPSPSPDADATSDLACVEISVDWEAIKAAADELPNSEKPNWPVNAYFNYDEQAWQTIFGTIDDDGTDVDSVLVFRDGHQLYEGKVRVWNPNKNTQKPYYWGRTKPFKPERFEFETGDKICAVPTALKDETYKRENQLRATARA